MSYLQRTSLADSPFAQTYNSAAWNLSTSPDTTTASAWTTSSGNGFDFTGSAYVFGYLVPKSNTLGSLRLGSSSPGDYTRGIFIDSSASSTRVMSDDMAIGYVSDSKHYAVSYSGFWGSYKKESRFNIIRIEI